MKNILLVMLLFSLLLADTVTVVYQEGIDGYSGCQDTYLNDDFYDQNKDSLIHGDEEDLIQFWNKEARSSLYRGSR